MGAMTGTWHYGPKPRPWTGRAHHQRTSAPPPKPWFCVHSSYQESCAGVRPGFGFYDRIFHRIFHWPQAPSVNRCFAPATGRCDVRTTDYDDLNRAITSGSDLFFLFLGVRGAVSAAGLSAWSVPGESKWMWRRASRQNPAASSPQSRRR